ncbi:MAG TPA: ThiF family adenylyltransferase [Patescibacteria group bacterium]|nr:ThiF family adenylyltransferase [Patescibacteria group bacterium]
MRIPVVGATGTGSVMAELLLRAGVGHLTLVDPDVVKP